MPSYTAQSKSAEAPDIEEGVADLQFVGPARPKIIKGGQFQKNPNGDPKLEWAFNVLDDDGNIIYEEREDNPSFGDPIEVSCLSGVGFNITSSTVPLEIKILKALLTKAEYAAFENGEGTPSDEVDAPEGLNGRIVQGRIFIKEGGWPGVTDIIAPRTKRRSSRTAQPADEE